jgi:hypothetical protein
MAQPLLYLPLTPTRPLTKFGSLRSTYALDEVAQLRDIIEDINGVSYRS